MEREKSEGGPGPLLCLSLGVRPTLTGPMASVLNQKILPCLRMNQLRERGFREERRKGVRRRRRRWRWRRLERRGSNERRWREFRSFSVGVSSLFLQ